MIDCRPFQPKNYIQFEGLGYYPYLNDDSPRIHPQWGTAFVAQPNEYCGENCVTIPLMMTDEYEILNEKPELLDDVRLFGAHKEFQYNFVGQCQYLGRQIFRTLELSDYDFEETGTVYSLGRKEKHEKLIDFWYRIAKSRFVFCPRGVGSSSFRTYQSLMVGSVPIVTGMKDLPFKSEVDWDSFAIVGDLEDLSNLILQAESLSEEKYQQMVANGMAFWNDYCEHNNLYARLERIIRENLHD